MVPERNGSCTTERITPSSSLQEPLIVVLEVKEEVVPELKEKVVPEVKEKVVPDLKDEVVPDLKAEVVPDLKAEVVPEFKEKLVPELKEEVAPTKLVELQLPAVVTQASEAVPIESKATTGVCSNKLSTTEHSSST